MTTTITIPWVPPTFNQYSRSHWTKQRAWVRVAALYIVAAAGKGPFTDGDGRWASIVPWRVKVTVQQYRKLRTDRDGATPKVLCDALVRLGWAVDDSELWMEQVVMPVIVSQEPKTVMTIEKL